MHAVTFKRYGSTEVLNYEQVEVPALAFGKVLVRVKSAAVNPLDWRCMAADPFLIRLKMGWLKPKQHRLGADFSGIVEAVGEGVQSFANGDEVLGTTFPDGLGAFADYVLVDASSIVPKPANISFDAASTLGIAALTALQGINQYVELGTGSSVLLNGASGGIGTFAIQIAKSKGAHVTAVCSERNVELVRSLGADEVIDYTVGDFTQRPASYDLIFDTVGTKSPGRAKRVLSAQGVVVYAAFDGWLRFGQILAAKTFGRKTGAGAVHLIIDLAKGAEPLSKLVKLFEEGLLNPVIDRCYPIKEFKEAIRYVQTKRARGKVVLKMDA